MIQRRGNRRQSGHSAAAGKRRALARAAAARRGRLEALEDRLLLAGGPVVISEFLAANDSVLADVDGDYSDWLELHNLSAATVDLGGWSLTDEAAEQAKWVFPSVNLPAGGYLVVFASGKDRRDPAGQLHANFKLDGAGEYLALVRPDGLAASELAPTYPEQFADVSYGLAADNVTLGYFLQPTPGVANGSDQTADPRRRILIDEIMYHPASRLDAHEYLELVNVGLQPVNVQNWRLHGAVDFVFPNRTLGVGQYLVVAADAAALAAKYPGLTNVVGNWTGRLSNSSDNIVLDDAVGRTIDRVEYADEGDWAVRARGPVDYGHTGWIWQAAHDGGGSSLEMVNRAFSNKYGQNWAASTALDGTPGGANSANRSDTAPLVLDVAHAPAVPHSTDPVMVTARILDELLAGVTARVYWRLDGQASFASAAMFDDGLHGDGAAGDRVYGATLPAQANGTIVEFYVSATDATSHTRTWPAPTTPDNLQQTNLLYQVSDAFDAAQPWTPGSQPLLLFIMKDAERAELADIGNGGGGEEQSNAQMNGTFLAFDGTGWQLRYNVGLRNRGHGSRLGPPNNYQLEIPHDSPWKGVTSLSINCRRVHSQMLGAALWQLAGLPAGDATLSEVRVNGVDLALPGGPSMFGSYVSIEVPDGDFAARHFPGDGGGNMYRGIRFDDNSQQADFRYEGSTADPYRDTYFKETNLDDDDWSDLIHLTDVLNNAPDATYLADVSQVLDVDQWLRYLALNSLALNLESGLNTGVGDDFAMYRGTTDRRFVLIPHDLDTLFNLGDSTAGVGYNIWTYLGVDGLARFLTHRDIAPRFYQAYLDVIADAFNPAVVNPLVDNLLGNFLPAANLNAIKQFVVDRTAAVLAQIPRDLTVSSALPVVSGLAYTGQATAALSGQADVVNARSVLVAGLEASWNAATGAWSHAAVPLSPGVNRVVVQAYDGPAGTGRLIDTAFLDVWYDPGGVATLGTTFSLPAGGLWSYLDDGSNQGTAWRANAFDDASWQSGYGQFGYGDGDEGTVVSFGGDATNKFVTTYYRRAFTVPTGVAAQLGELSIGLLRDDGAAVYLNGVEVVRSNLPGTLGDATVTSSTLALATVSGANESTYFSFAISPTALQDGLNVLAVEVHQFARGTSDPDHSFDLRLTGSQFAGDLQPISLAAGSLWKYLDDGSNQAVAWRGIGFDDGAWRAGRAQLGYGDGDEQTVVGFVDTDPGTAGTQKNITTYFRTAFNVTAAELANLIDLSLTLTVDDGAAVFVNGAEVVREGLPGTLGDNTIAYTTLASANNENLVKTLAVSPAALRSGKNVVAVEVHQRANDSSDISFNLQLKGTRLGSTGVGTAISGTLAANTTLTAAGGPYHVVGDLTVPAGITLTIQPGATLFFDADRQLIVGGRLVAEGTPTNLIRFTHLPGTPAVWGGIQFANTMADNRLSHAVVEWGGTTNNLGLVGLDGSNLAIDGVTFDHAERRRIRSQNSSLIVRHSTFTDIFGPGVAPTSDNFSEQIWGGGIPAGGHWIVQDNYFGTTKGHNDIIDFDPGVRPAPIAQILDNVFTGGGDDALDLEGDAHIEGNLVMNFIKDQWNAGVGNSNALSAGAGHHYVMVRNRFYHGEHVVQVKDDSFLTFVNNTAADFALPAIYFLRPDGTVYGKGAYLDGNVFGNVATIFGNVQPTTDLTVNRSIVNAGDLALGAGNLAENPRLADPARGDFSLRPGSPALGTGPNGADMGALVPAGATIAGEPPATTFLSGATLTVGGPDLWAYRYRLDGGAWSAERSVANPGTKSAVLPPIQLSGLGGGAHRVDVIAKNSAGEWQSTTSPTQSQSWTVNATLSQLIINEVLADNAGVLAVNGTYPDVIELYNAGASAVNLSGMSLSDDPAVPARYVFPAGTILAAGQYLLRFAAAGAGLPPTYTGFSLDSAGEGVYLYASAAQGGGLVDSVAFGLQVPNLSIGRVGHDRHWALTQPTLGAANIAQRTGDPATLLVNEWFTDGDVRLVDDFLELDNPDPLPVALGGLWLTDDPAAAPDKHAVAPLSFVAGDGYVDFHADDDEAVGADHVNFKLRSERGWLGLLAADGRPIDQQLYLGQTTDYAQGREPDGNDFRIFFLLPTPGIANDPPGVPPGYSQAYGLLIGLRITEIMYNPPGGAAYEYIELANVGGAALELAGVRLGGLDATLPAASLAPDEYGVLVHDAAAFRARYGNGPRILGTFAGELNNGGETLVLQLPEPFDAAVLRFAYNDSWYPTTDGGGASLEIVNPAARANTWDERASWRASGLGGSPGGQVPWPAATIADVSVVEGNSGSTNLVFTVTVAQAGPVASIVYATAPGTATPGVDYTSVGGTLTFSAGQTSRIVVVPVAGDTLNEADETFFLNLSAPTNVALLDTQAVATILDNDPLPSAAIADALAAEGQSGTTILAFTVTLSAISGREVLLPFSTSAGTATAGADFVAQSGTLTLVPGQTTAVVSIAVVGDVVVEPDEAFSVNLGPPTNAVLGDGQAVGTIANDDVAGGTWQNPRNALDVNDDGLVTPQDVLIVINDLNSKGIRVLDPPVPPNVPPPYIDVTGDGLLGPQDALVIINYLNSLPPSPGAGEPIPRGAAGKETGESPCTGFAAALAASAASTKLPFAFELDADLLDLLIVGRGRMARGRY